ncbi:MAG: hypothetical protein IJ574_02385 [Bacilli bacterium]|nr:hypothetical protein [Bacilli bacterium]
MSLENRYKFLKKMYPSKLILIYYDKKVVSCYLDKKIFLYLSNDISRIKEKNISYLLLDGLEIIESNNYQNNNYLLYKKKILINEVLLSAVIKKTIK